MFQVVNTCTKMGDANFQVLLSKHIEARMETTSSMYRYAGAPSEILTVDVTVETITDMVLWVFRGVRTGGIDVVIL